MLHDSLTPSHLFPAEYLAGKCWWRRRGNQKSGRWVAERDTPRETASGSSDTLPPVLPPSAVRRTRRLLRLLSSLLPLRPCPFLSPSPRWKRGWCPGELEGGNTGSLWADRTETLVINCTVAEAMTINSTKYSTNIKDWGRTQIVIFLLCHCDSSPTFLHKHAHNKGLTNHTVNVFFELTWEWDDIIFISVSRLLHFLQSVKHQCSSTDGAQ